MQKLLDIMLSIFMSALSDVCTLVKFFLYVITKCFDNSSPHLCSPGAQVCSGASAGSVCLLSLT